MSKEKLIEKLRAANVVSLGRVTLRAGMDSNYYFDIKKAYGDPSLLKYMAEAITKSLDPNCTALAVSGHGGIPLGTMVSHFTGLPLSLVRDKHKEHGRQRPIDGYCPSENDTVNILDDVFTSGNSLHGTAAFIEQCNAEVTKCSVVVARSDPFAFRLPVTYLISSSELL